MDTRDALAMAEHLLELHGLHDWSVEFDRAKRRAGVCRFGTRTIGLSEPLTRLHEEWEVRDTVLHEIAHALAGPGHGHDAVWGEIARRIGGSGARCVPADLPTPEGAWVGTCSAGHTTTRHRRPERVMTCGRCSRGFDVAHLFAWTHHGRAASPGPAYEAELAAVLGGRTMWRVDVGVRVRLRDVEGRRTGVVVRRGRTTYDVRCGREVVRVPLAGVEPL